MNAAKCAPDNASPVLACRGGRRALRVFQTHFSMALNRRGVNPKVLVARTAIVRIQRTTSSLQDEGFGLDVISLFSCGCPLIATQCYKYLFCKHEF